MTTVTPEEIRELATLARLSLDEQEVEQFRTQLADILGYIGTLRSVDVTDVPEFLSEKQPDSSLREDLPGVQFSSETALSSAPQTRGRLVVVPKFKED
ncbi:MAG: Asp-tRNA(Asn)/Glu-tRNA(Gln) amidotransferase subunit GatC [Nannocystaceae bacterium]